MSSQILFQAFKISLLGTFTHVESMEGKQTSKHLQKVPSGNLKWPFIVDLPIKNGGSFHSYVSLPEGT
jgi:hypothetical protein